MLLHRIAHVLLATALIGTSAAFATDPAAGSGPNDIVTTNGMPCQIITRRLEGGNLVVNGPGGTAKSPGQQGSGSSAAPDNVSHHRNQATAAQHSHCVIYRQGKY